MALIVIALLVTSSAVGIQFLLNTKKDDAQIINIAGMQRMLSQKIALYSHQMTQITPSEESNRQALTATLLNALARFEQNHWFLVREDAKNNTAPHLSDVVNGLYFDAQNGQKALHTRVIEYIEHGRQLAQGNTDEVVMFQWRNSEKLLSDLDELVSQFELEANARVRFLSRLELLLWLLTIGVLVIELFFIFRPMERRVRDAFKIAEDERNKAIAAQLQAEQANQAKSQFLAARSHELRTPMNGIFGMIELAASEKLEKKRRDFLHKARVSGEQLLRIINDILDIAKIEASKIDLESKDFELNKMLDAALAPVAISCEKKGLVFEYVALSAIPNWVTGDVTRLGQVLNNLLSNALKFTDEGKIRVTANVKVINRAFELEFSVTDTGIGMTSSQLSTVFDKFTQADNSTTRVYGGTGLGLAISKELVQLMGGDIRVESEAGVGSQFWVNVPLKRSEQKHALSRHSDVSSGRRVAIVDDLDTSRHYLASILSQLNITCDHYGSANAFLEADNQSCEYKVVVVDLHMPEMDGVTMIDQLRSRCSDDCPKFILVSAAADLNQYREDKEKRFFAVFNKPVDEQRFFGVMKQLMKETEDRMKPLKVLLVEDNDINAQIASHMLHSEGHTVTHAANGKIAVAQAENHQFDVILMDINMPEMDGLTASKIIKNELKLDVPIIALSANAYEADRMESIEAGMSYHLSKPINKDALIAVVDKVIIEHEQGAATE